jgi:hypothetical protein
MLNRSKLHPGIVGHTDNQEQADDNLRLSERRAQSVISALVANHGIDVVVSFLSAKACPNPLRAMTPMTAGLATGAENSCRYHDASSLICPGNWIRFEE